MGWLFQDEPIQNPVQHLTKEYTHEDTYGKTDVLDAARVRNTVYMAVRRTYKTTANSYIFAAVILIRNNKRDGFGYKNMDESMGPCECDCPDRIMRLLSPIEDLPNPSYAAEWRARVAARKTQRMTLAAKRALLRPGATILLPAPVTFRGGISATQFRVTAVIGRRHVLQPIGHPGFNCGLRQDTLAEATIIPAQPPDQPPLPPTNHLPAR